jgi:predicted short-subunit dehydrogenase-like oxidoreductase (DUF2520 family)
MAKITLIGSGKTATALGKALATAHHQFVQVWSRSEANATVLAKILHASATDDLNSITGEADIYIIAVKDDAIGEVSQKLRIGNKIVAHTSGIKSKDVLTSASLNYGIFYPFVSMTKEIEVDFNNALIMAEGSNEQTVLILSSLARSISDNVKIAEEKQRMSLHLAAVFAHNFTNHMYTIAEQILSDKGLNFDELRPLIAAHTQSILHFSPYTLQTGPAIRHDQTTINTHMDILGNDSESKQIYLTMTEAIQQWYKDK